MVNDRSCEGVGVGVGVADSIRRQMRLVEQEQDEEKGTMRLCEKDERKIGIVEERSITGAQTWHDRADTDQAFPFYLECGFYFII